MEKQKYYVGLDMGTSSVGWAVTDTNYKLIRKKGKDFWGVREFDEAKTSVDRRSKRIARRRRQREQVRIGYLKKYFEEAVLREDPLFYVRLDNSKYYFEDKDESLKTNAGVFADENYTDKKYFEEYPTIFHLRMALINDEVERDEKYARLVYLAILNMFKHRGHFLDQNLSDDAGSESFELIYASLVDVVSELFDMSIPFKALEVEKILADKTISRTVKKERIIEELSSGKASNELKQIVGGMCGLTINFKTLFGLEDEEKISCKFSDVNYDEKVDELAEKLGEDKFELVSIMKQIYDAGTLSSILKGNQYLSEARVSDYEKHKADLALLKSVYRDCKSLDEYDAMFRLEGKANYSAYVNSVNSSKYNEDNTPMRRSMSNRSRDDFYAEVKKQLKGIEDERVEKILLDIETETFMPKQLTSMNGVIPNQVHKREMVAILNQASQTLDFLNDVDESGLAVKDRIVKLFEFQIPYYIGPVSLNSAKHKGNGWVVRKEDGEVLPWNFEQKIDIEKTQEAFIERLIRDCTYISGEKVLPKNSLLYEEFKVLNEINNLKIRGDKITVEQKQDIFNDLYKTTNKVTKKKLVTYMIGRSWIEDDNELSGIDISLNNQLSSYHKMKSIFHEKIEEDKYKEVAERIIKLACIYGDSKKTLKKILADDFGDILSENDIKKLAGMKFKDWGRLSREFLELQGCITETGEICSLISAMRNTNSNLMEIINDTERYTFKKALEEKAVNLNKTLSDIHIEDLDELYFSAPVKRMVWQTLLLLKEIQKVMGCAPDRIFIEMTRNEGDKVRTTSREKELKELYKNVRDLDREWEKEIEAFANDGALRQKKLYLYYKQMGCCMYTGNPIDLDELFTTKYDIDHIYPRHFVKDDNINNNLVLVNKTENARKSDSYPVEVNNEKAKQLWNRLHAAKFISDEKYHRLTRKTPFSDEEKAGFIARQLVETSQGTKGVADLLKMVMPENTTIVYAKAGNVSDFRRDNDYLKSRLINDMHHAKDAYLNIVVGNVYYTKFTQSPINYIKKDMRKNEKEAYHLCKMFRWDVERNGYVAWKAGKLGDEGASINIVDDVMRKNTPLLTRLTFEAKGAFTNETLYSAKKSKEVGYIPFKTSDNKMSDVKKYGGFTNVSGAYFFLVEHTVKNKRVRTLEMIPKYLKNNLEKSEDALKQYCIYDLQLESPLICVKEIKMQSLVEINGYRVRISGRTGKQIILRNETQLKLDNKWNNYIHYIEKYLERGEMPKGKIKNEEGDYVLVNLLKKEKNIELYKELIHKHTHGSISKKINGIGEKLNNSMNDFELLSVTDQCKLLKEIIGLTSVGPTSGDLSLIGGASKTGVMLFSKKITEAVQFELIHQSVTGLYETKVDLLKV